MPSLIISPKLTAKRQLSPEFSPPHTPKRARRSHDPWSSPARAVKTGGLWSPPKEPGAELREKIKGLEAKLADADLELNLALNSLDGLEDENTRSVLLKIKQILDASTPRQMANGH